MYYQWQTTPLAFHSILKAILRGYSSLSHRQRWKHLDSCPELSVNPEISNSHLQASAEGTSELDWGRLLHLNLLSKQFPGKRQRWTHKSHRFSPTQPAGSLWYVTTGDIHAGWFPALQAVWLLSETVRGYRLRPPRGWLATLNQGLALASAWFRQYHFRQKLAQILLWQCCHHVSWCGFWLLYKFLVALRLSSGSVESISPTPAIRRLPSSVESRGPSHGPAWSWRD